MQQQSELTEGWVETSLKHILSSLESGSRPKGGVRGISKGIPSIGGEHLNGNGGFRFDKIKFVSEEFFEKMNQGIIRVNDILIVKDGATTGKVSIVTKDFPYDKVAVNEHVFLCRLHLEISPNYIFYFLFSEIGQQRILNNFRGSAQGGINKNFAPNTIIPLSPLAEQHRIVSVIESLFARLGAANERLERVPEILKKFRQSVLAAACDGRLTEGWREENQNIEYPEDFFNQISEKHHNKYIAACETAKRKGEIAPKKPKNIEPTFLENKDFIGVPEKWIRMLLPDTGYMNRGTSRNRPRNDPSLFGGKYPFIQTEEIARSNGRITTHKKTYNENGLAQSKLWPKGTVCITIAANIANSGILTYPACFPDSVVGVIPDDEICNNEYLEYFVRTAKDNLSQFAPATAQKNINIAILNDVAIPLPPLLEQHEIVRRVDALFALADSIEAKVAAAKERTEKLRQSILAKAFSGALVETEAELARREGRNYEPADVLLERIRDERGKGGKKGKSAK